VRRLCAARSKSTASDRRHAGEEGAVVVAKVLESKDSITATTRSRATLRSGEGRRHRPTKVTRTALQNAASIGSVADHRALIVEIPEQKAAPAGGGHGGGMDGMY